VAGSGCTNIHWTIIDPIQTFKKTKRREKMLKYSNFFVTLLHRQMTVIPENSSAFRILFFELNNCRNQIWIRNVRRYCSGLATQDLNLVARSVNMFLSLYEPAEKLLSCICSHSFMISSIPDTLYALYMRNLSCTVYCISLSII